MKTYWEVEVQVYIFLNSVLVGCQLSASRHGCFNSGEGYPGILRIEGLMGPRTELEDVEQKILDPTTTRTHTARSSSPQPVAIPTTLSQLTRLLVLGLFNGAVRSSGYIASNGSMINE
jgi:hypothetical protein